MKTIRLLSGRVAFAVVCITIGWMFWSAGNAFTADQAPPANLSPGLQEVVKLSQAQMGDNVILAYIKNSGASYTLGADDILYLKGQGVSQNVIAALLQTKSAASSPSVSTASDAASGTTGTSAPAPASSGTPPEPGGGGSTALPFPMSLRVANTENAQASGVAPQENTGLVQEYNGYIFELKECRVEDRQDRPVNDGRPHQQLVCKVFITNKMGDRNLAINAWNRNEHTRVIDDQGNEYDCNGGSLGTSEIRMIVGLGSAENVLPSGVPVKATLLFGVNNGVGYFSTEAKALSILDILVTGDNEAGRRLFHIQFKNVPIPLVEGAPVLVTAAPAPPASTPPPALATSAEPVVNADYVQEQLTPYGTWVDVPGYGRCWQPSELPDGWRPYYDSGHWVYTDAGLYWQSDYPWGAIPFHYGRWAYVGGYGWIWAPGYEYAPAWVFWRHCDGYLGWAPLPYGAVWVAGGWWEYRGVRVAADYDFGFGPRFFVFVDHRHFWEHDYHPFVLRGEERDHIYRISVINRVRVDGHGRFVHEGLERDRLERFTGRKVEERSIGEVRERDHEVMRNHYTEAARTHAEKVRTERTPTRETPGRETPGRETSGRETSGGNAPSTKPPTPPAASERTPRETPAGKTPSKETPGKETPSKESPSKDNGKEKKDQNQSKGNTNQHFAQLKGSAGS